MNTLAMKIENIISDELAALARPDLFREPLVAFSAATDPRYEELKTLIGPWHLLPQELLPTAKSVISYFVPFTKEVVRAPKKAKQAAPTWGEAYVVINNHFARINEALCAYLKEQGFEAMTIPATHTYDPKDMKSMWSHRSAAAIAGLGAFGANRMLLTAKGSGGRFCTVLTSAELPVTAGEPANPCLYVKDGSCGRCFEICPVKALHPDDLDLFACQAQTKRNERFLADEVNLGEADTCGKCIAVCPVAYLK